MPARRTSPGTQKAVPYDMESRVARLEEGLDNVRGEIHNLAGLIHDLSDNINRRERPNWNVYFSGLGVLLAFVLSVGGGALAPLYLMSSNNSAQLAESVKSITERIDSKIENVNTIRENEMKSMDEVLQREMRLLNDAQDTDTSHLQQQLLLVRTDLANIDERLRSHTELPGHPTAVQRHNETSKRLDVQHKSLENRVRDLDEKLQREMVLADATALERIRSLDEKLQTEIKSIEDEVRQNILVEALQQLRGDKD